VLGRDKVLELHRGKQRLAVAVGTSHRRFTSPRSITPSSLSRGVASIGISTAC
jgi:hypothetical protein